MKKIFIYIITCLLCFSACKDYLDVVPDNVATMDNAFSNRTNTEKFLFTCYNCLQSPSNLFFTPGLLMSRECWLPYEGWQHINEGGDVNGSNLYTWNIARGLQNTNNPLLSYWTGGGGAFNIFIGIRDCNIFLENIHKPVDIPDNERTRWTAEIKFLKAYYHYFLLRTYGPIPIVDVNIPVSSTPDEVRVYREPVEDVAKFIVDLLDEAAEDLPLVIMNEAQELGRVTKPIALAVKAQVLAMMASPRFNGHAYFRNLKDNRNKFLFPQEEDPGKWATAAQAIKEAIDCAEKEGNHRLYYYNGFYEVISPSTRTELDIRGALTEKWNPEIVWGTSKGTDYIQRQAIPRIEAESAAGANTSTLSVTMDMVERFYTKNGVPIDEDKTLESNYVNRYNLRKVTSEDKYLMEEGFETAVLHFDRESRFYASITFDGGMYFGNGHNTDDPERAFYVHLKSGQNAGRLAAEKYSITGYLPKKTVNVITSVYGRSNYTPEPYSFPYIRLADLYLLYAEALNETKSSPDADVYKYIDIVRARAGLKGVVESWTNYSSKPYRITDKAEMRKIIHQERLIELAFEEAPFWDIMRWMEAEDRWNAPIKGWNAFGGNTLTFYELTTITQSVFPIREYFWPIKQSELDKNVNLVQNPRW